MNTLHLVTLSGRRLSLPSLSPQDATAWIRKAESRGPVFRSAVFHSVDVMAVIKRPEVGKISPREH